MDNDEVFYEYKNMVLNLAGRLDDVAKKLHKEYGGSLEDWQLWCIEEIKKQF